MIRRALLTTTAMVALAACAPPGIPPTPTRTPAPLPTAFPTAAPSLTPTPSGSTDLTGVVLTAADLPPGFEPGTPQAMTAVVEGFTRAPFYDVVGASGFTARRDLGPEIIVTFSGTYTEDDPLRADAPVEQQPLYAVYMFIVGAGTQAITGDGPITGLEGIGEQAVGRYGTADLSGQSIRVDMVIVRRGRLGVYVFHLYPLDFTPQTSVVILAHILDGRLAGVAGP